MIGRACELGALGGTRTPSLLIRRSMPSVQPVRHQTPTLAGPSHHSRYRHAQTHRHVNGTVILMRLHLDPVWSAAVCAAPGPVALPYRPPSDAERDDLVDRPGHIWPDRDESTRAAVDAVIAARAEQRRNNDNATAQRSRSQPV